MSVRTRTRSGRPVVIPAPREDDFEDVHWALSAANTLWERGEDTEALKWLRRAASAAADRDADVRAVELFKAAADVAGVVDAKQEIRAARALDESNAGADSQAQTQAMKARGDGAPQTAPAHPPAPHAAPGAAGHVNHPARTGRPAPPHATGRPVSAPAPAARQGGRATPTGRPRARSRAINRGPVHASQPQRQQPHPAPAAGSSPGPAPHFRQNVAPAGVRPGQTGPPPPPQPRPARGQGARKRPPPMTAPRHTQAGPPTRLTAQAPVAAQPAPRTERVSSTEPRDLVPPVPPEPRLSERFAGLPFQDTEEDTFIRPETMLRRALMAIDPQYAARTDIDRLEEDDEDDEDDSSPGGYVAHRPFFEARDTVDDDEEDTSRRRARDDTERDATDGDEDDEATRERVGDLVAAADQRKLALSTSGSEPPVAPAPAAHPAGASVVPGIAAFRVAVLPIPEENDVRLIFLTPGAVPPPGVATALLVPPSAEDARLINEIFNETDAKL